MIDHSFRSHFTEPFSSFILPMTESHLRDTLLSADLQASTPHHPTTATIYTDPPATHHGHFFPNNPMPYMAPSATHQPELLLLNWMLCTITTLVDDLQHHPIVQDPTPPMSSFINTPAYTDSTTPQHPASLDQHDPRSPTRAQHSTIPARFSRIPRALAHGPHCDTHTRPNQLSFRHEHIEQHRRYPCYPANRHTCSPSTTPSPGSIPFPRTLASYHTFTSEPYNTPQTTSDQHHPHCCWSSRAPSPCTLDGFYHSNC